MLAITLFPAAAQWADNSIAGLSRLGWLSFLFMWLFQLIIFRTGMEAIRKFIDFCGPAVYVVMLLLALWILSKTGLSSLSLQLSDKTLSTSETITQMAKAAMLIVAYFAALLLNFGDFSRFSKSEESMKLGNVLGLPVNFCVFAVITVIVTAGTISVFGKAIMDPIAIVEQIGNPLVAIVGSVTFIIATMGINIVANFVSPAYDIANLYPEKIDFKTGGLIASLLAVLVCPWQFVGSAQAITLFVGIFGSVLGPMYGIMVADYYLIKRQQVDVADLYTLSPRGSLFFEGGWNTKALYALGLSGALSIGLSLLGAFDVIYNVGDWGWLIGSTTGAILYVGIARTKRPVAPVLSGSV